MCGHEGRCLGVLRICLYCASSGIACIIPQPFDAIRYGYELDEVFHAGYLHRGASYSGRVFAEGTYNEYQLVLAEDMSGCVWLDPAKLCTAEARARVHIE